MKPSPAKTGILLAAYGSSSLLGERALSLFAQDVRRTFPGVPVRWAYTSDRMRTRLAAEGKKTDSVKKALCRMAFERYEHVAVQSLHLIPGVEYEALIEETLRAKADGGPKDISVGLPLLYDHEDVLLATQALLAHLPEKRKNGEPVICMGHGTWHTGAAGYQALAGRLAEADPRIFIGTLESDSIATILSAIAAGSSAQPPPSREDAKNVWLLPLLSTIGKHAEQDMAGTHPASWRSRIEAAGFSCRPVLKGTVEYAGFAEIWLKHLADALDLLQR
jgi:sirohydrochlorin cobaltochelatase